MIIQNALNLLFSNALQKFQTKKRSIIYSKAGIEKIEKSITLSTYYAANVLANKELLAVYSSVPVLAYKQGNSYGIVLLNVSASGISLFNSGTYNITFICAK